MRDPTGLQEAQRALVLNPPLLVPPQTIDLPQYAFVGPLAAAAHLVRRGVAVRWVDAFLLSDPTRLGDGWLRLGPEIGPLLDRLHLEQGGFDLVVVAHPPWARLERNFREILTPLLAGLETMAPCRVLADAALGEAHYVRMDPEWLLQRFSSLAAWVEREPEAPLDALLEGRAHPRLHRRSSAPAILHTDDQVVIWSSGLWEEHPRVDETAPTVSRRSGDGGGGNGAGDEGGDGGGAGAGGGAGGGDRDWEEGGHSALVDPARYAAWFRHEALSSLRHGQHLPRARFPVMTSRGCPFQCTFCTSEKGRGWVGSPLDALRRDFAALRHAGIEEVVILDPIANANRDHFVNVLDALEAAGLRASFPNGLRIDRLGPGELGRLARLVDQLPVSVETADSTVMRRLRKHLSLEAARRTLALAHEVGLPLGVHYIIGLPGESAARVNRTLEFAFDAWARWGAEPLVQGYVPPERLAVPTPEGEGLSPAVYAAFHDAPLPVAGALPVSERARFLDSARRKRDARTQSKLVINVSYRCNNRCRFCSVGDRERVDGRWQDQIAALDRAARRGVTLLDIDGGEPTLYPRLLELLDAARNRGFETITITTNGRMLVYGGLARELAQRSVRILVSLHGPEAGIHEALTRAEGSFGETLQGVEVARQAGILAGVNTTVVRENLPHLGAMAALLVERGVEVWNVQALTPFGEAIGRQDLAPTWQEMRPVLRDVLEAWGERLQIQLVGLPPCWQEEVAPEGLDDYHKGVRQMLFVDGSEVNLGAYLEGRRLRGPECEGCARRLLCGGYWDFVSSFEDAHRQGPPPLPRRGSTARNTAGTRRPALEQDAARQETAGQDGVNGLRSAAAPGRHARSRGLTDEGPVRLLDLIPGYACNVQCDYCSVTAEMRQRNLSYEQVVPLLRQGRAHGIEAVGIGGGEPTLRPDFLRLVRTARRLGYRTIKAQTNGLRFADPEFTRRAVEAGLNLVHISFMTCRPGLYDRITGLPGSQGLVERAVDHLLGAGVSLAGDLILKSDTVDHIHETVAYWHERGVETHFLWLVSLTDRNRDQVASLWPVSRMFPHLARAFDYARGHGIKVLSRHIPPCQLPGYRDHVVRLGDEDVWVVTPDASFWLLESAISANCFVDACGRCRWRGVCWGVREDYLARFGDSEIQPITTEDPPPRVWER